MIARPHGARNLARHVLRILGKNNLGADESSERVDAKILEPAIDLDPGSKLALGAYLGSFVQLTLESTGSQPWTRAGDAHIMPYL